MNECMLMEMMGELNPQYLDNNWMEKEAKRNGFFSSFFEKSSKKEGFSFSLTGTEFSNENLIDFPGKEEVEEAIEETLLCMGVEKKKSKGVYAIISGIAVAVLVIFGIVLFIIKRDKRGGMLKTLTTI